MRTTYDILQKITQYLQPDRLEQLSNLVKSIKVEDFDETKVKFLKNYTINALRCVKNYNHRNMQRGQGGAAGSLTNFFKGKNKNQNQAQMIDDQKFIDLKMFWAISQESNKAVSLKTRELSYSCLIDILGISNKQAKLNFVMMALDNLTQGQSVF